MKKSDRMIKTLISSVLIIVLGLNILPMFVGCKKASKEKVVLSLWGATEDQELLEDMVESFKEKYKDKAEFEITVCEESEVTCRDTVMFNPKLAADVYAFAGDQLYDLVKCNGLKPVTDNLDAVFEANGGKDSAILEAASYNGQLYAYPMTASNGYFLFYNSKYLSEEDVKSFDKILEVCEKNNKKVGMELNSGWYLYSFFKAAGLDVAMNEDGKGNTCNWNSETNSIKGVDVLDGIFKIAGHKGFMSVDSDSLVKAAEDGELIAGVSGTWNAMKLKDAFKEGYAATILPRYTVGNQELQMHSVSGYKMIGVNPNSENEYWATKLAEWITSEENQILRFNERGEGPANVNAVKSADVQKSPAIAALSSQMEFAHIQTVSDVYWTETYKLGTIIIAGNPEKKSSQQLLDELVESIK